MIAVVVHSSDFLTLANNLTHSLPHSLPHTLTHRAPLRVGMSRSLSTLQHSPALLTPPSNCTHRHLSPLRAGPARVHSAHSPSLCLLLLLLLLACCLLAACLLLLATACYCMLLLLLLLLRLLLLLFRWRRGAPVGPAIILHGSSYTVGRHLPAHRTSLGPVSVPVLAHCFVRHVEGPVHGRETGWTMKLLCEVIVQRSVMTTQRSDLLATLQHVEMCVALGKVGSNEGNAEQR